MPGTWGDLESFRMILECPDNLEMCPDNLERENLCTKILQNHLLCAFVANLKIDALYTLDPESFCGKNLAIRKVFAFCDSVSYIDPQHWAF